MTRDDAARLLNVAPNAKRGEVDTAFTSLRLHYVNLQQFSTQPRERDDATRALGLIQEAYVTLTGQSSLGAKPTPPSAATIVSDDIPRVSLGGRRVNPKPGATGKSPKPAGQSRWKWRLLFQRGWPNLPYLWSANRETAVAMAICVAILLFAILMLVRCR